MNDFCVISDNKVVNVILCETKEIAESITNTLCVKCPWGVGIGWTYEGGKFVAPEQPVKSSEDQENTTE
jgi:hypothetical protein